MWNAHTLSSTMCATIYPMTENSTTQSSLVNTCFVRSPQRHGYHQHRNNSASAFLCFGFFFDAHFCLSFSSAVAPAFSAQSATLRTVVHLACCMSIPNSICGTSPCKRPCRKISQSVLPFSIASPLKKHVNA